MYFTLERIKRILDELSGYIYPDSEPVNAYKMKQGYFKGGEQVNLDTSDWETFVPEGRWGGKNMHYWFRTAVTIPERFDGKPVLFEVATGREGQWDAVNPQFLVYVNGKLVQGLDVNHRNIILSENARSGEIFHIALAAYSGMKEGLVELNTKISIQDRETEKLFYNIKVPYEIAVLLDKEDKKRIDILGFLNEAINLLDLRKPFFDRYSQSVRAANAYLQGEFYEKYCGCSDITAVCVGHTHIDVAWLWTLSQTREKVTRSFSTVLNLMKQYPEYIFMSSQPQLYKYIKEDHPEIYAEIKQRVREGRWEPEGAMWLEADCNLASGESLVRQVLYGTRFFEKEFGVQNKILWLPDVFGYSAALPQILKKSGIDYFVTTKIGWNEYNKMPYDTFMWKGIDGTEILTHFITATNYQNVPTEHNTTYNSLLNPTQIMGSWRRYQQKELHNETLVAFGYGDGGGGPTKEMLENARRMEKGIPGCPKVRIGKSLDYFRKLEKTVSGKNRLPKWVGELYLEYHRGTYTSMARNKKYNRKSELLYQDAEFLSVMDAATSRTSSYPKEQLDQGWETILLNQFHDILPGSSIKEVYEDSQKQYLEVLDKGNRIVNTAIDSISGGIALQSVSAVVFNQLSFSRSDIVEIGLPQGYEDITMYDELGKAVASQKLQNGKVAFYAANVPSKGYKAFTLKPISSAQAGSGWESSVQANPRKLTNRFYDITLDESANITSIYDKTAGREAVKAGEKANVLQAFEDKPLDYDAWNINIYYQEKMWEVKDVQCVQVIEWGPVLVGLKIVRKFLDSTIVQVIRLYNDIPRIDFVNTIDWKEKQVLLKTSFPVDVHSDKASYEIQYGNVERPTHWNTSWDYARFEVCAHKWADLSEDNYGVSLLNDCKYGYDIKEGNIRLTLLKSAIEPNIDADREMHEFTYSLYPHTGAWKEGGTVAQAYALNCPMYAKVEEAHPGDLPSTFSLAGVDHENIVIEVIKKAEDSEDIIIRVYECYNRRTKATLTFSRELKEVWDCSLMEVNIKKLAISGNSFIFEIKPYEIKTFKLMLA